ncbi:MAG TPA: DNA-3-methyladenine glycosylase I [Chthoniobacterales bacterium]
MNRAEQPAGAEVPGRKRRCDWCPPDDPLYVKYHDEEWGVPVRNGRHLFEMLCLEGAQAGLSWRVILHKRSNYRSAFLGFQPERLSSWTEADVARALTNPGIVRNRRKVEAVVGNARAVVTHFNGDLDRFAECLWTFVDGKPIQHGFVTAADVPAEDSHSRALSAALQKLGFKFVGPTIVYAFMQAVGMVNDHLTGCFRHAETS